MSDLEQLAKHASEATQMLKELANQNRLMICCSLVEQELSVSELNQRVPLSQSALSQHLARLREVGFLGARRDGQTIYYSLKNPNIIKVIGLLKSIYCPE